MALFDRFVPRKAAEPERTAFQPIPYRRMFSELDAAGKEAKARYPDDNKTVDDFVWALKAACRDRHRMGLEGDLPDMKAEARFFLSKDRMRAFACLLPPENKGEGIVLEEFLEDMYYEGITYGVLQEDIPQEFALGYLHIFPVARGTPPASGEDGEVTELFQRHRSTRLEVQNGSEVDFSQEFQPIRKGTDICLIRPPKPGTDGMDVTGEGLPSIQSAAAPVPQGKNTAVSGDGHALTASVDGILYIEDGQFCVHEQRIIEGSLDRSHGTLQISGSVYIDGDVDGGAAVEASGDIVISGKVGQARVSSTGGTIRVQQGILGTSGETFVSAAGQVQAPVVEWTEIKAGTSVIAESVLNSTIRCGGTVYAMTGRGIIVNSRIWAGDSVLCLRIGNLAGGRSQFSIGYPPHLPESWDRIKAELAQVQATIDKLWKPIVNLRKKGSRISDGEKSLLDQLVVQRDLYTEKRETLMTELRAVNKALDKKSRGRVRCEKVHPYLSVQIGKLLEEITTIEENCNIRVEENKIAMK